MLWYSIASYADVCGLSPISSEGALQVFEGIGVIKAVLGVNSLKDVSYKLNFMCHVEE